MRVLLVLAFTFLGPMTSIEARADICAIRPDLCGGKSIKKKKSTKRGARKPATVADLAVKKKKATAAKCRQANQPYNLDDADLPICGREETDEVSSPRHSVKSRPQVSFDSYMQANASHPALHRRPASMGQNAFVQRPQAVLSNEPPVVQTEDSSPPETGQ